MMFEKYLKTVVGGDYLSIDEAYMTAGMLLHDNIPEIKAAAFLSAMRTRKESSDELRGFVQALYEEAVTLNSDLELIDTCGTGGDGLGTFNISTVAALLVAACGVPVAKHGNSAVTGKVGSADVLEALGVNTRLGPDEALALLDNAGITFLFAPMYHPVLKQVGGLRRGMGVATIFNFLGPLLNPFKLRFQVMGVSDPSLQDAVARTLADLGRDRAMVICAENGMDEISPNCLTRVYDTGIDGDSVYSIDPAALGISPFPLDSIKGGDIQTCTRIVIDVLEGQKGPYRETSVLNAAAALLTAGTARDMQEGMLMAYEAIDSGKARATLQKMITYSRDRVISC